MMQMMARTSTRLKPRRGDRNTANTRLTESVIAIKRSTPTQASLQANLGSGHLDLGVSTAVGQCEQFA